MLPENTLSTQAVVTGYPDPVKAPGDFLVDWERAGVYLNDPSQGLLAKLWTVRGVPNDETGEVEVWLSAPGGVTPDESTRMLFSAVGITEVALSFDQNMNPFVAYVQSGSARMYWYDSVLGEQTHTDLPAGARTPRCTIDDKRSFNVANADNVLAYVKGGNLVVAYQRERYSVEHVLASVGPAAELLSVAMNSANRLQFRVRKSAAGDSRFAVKSAPILAEVAQTLSERAGLTRDKIRVTDLWNDEVNGFVTTNAYPCSSSLQSLSEIFHFGPSNQGGVVNFVKRGANSVARIVEDDLIADDQDIETQSKRGDTVGVPRVLHLNYYDYRGGLNTDKQHSERPEGSRAEGEASTQTAVVLTADQAATVVAKNHAIMVEAQKGELNISLPDNWLHLTDTDPIIVSYGGKSVRGIIAESIISDGEQRYKVIRDRQSVYTMQVEGIPAAPIARPPSSIVGPTVLHVLDVPHLFDGDDALGVYLALSGIMPAWQGAYVEMSIDGGENYLEGQTIRVDTIVGTLTSELGTHPADFPDYINACTVSLATPDAVLSPATLAAMMNRRNLALIGDEIVNFGAVDEVSPGVWNISTWLRGRNGSQPSEHPIGTRFVMLGGAVFVPAELTMLGRPITVRATSIGASLENATVVTFTFSGRNQIERSPAYLQARRDADNVVASWQGVGRLGGGVHVAMGAHFAGFLVTLTDGTATETHNTLLPEYTGSLSAFAGPVSVRVQQRNNFTGLGPAIEVTI